MPRIQYSLDSLKFIRDYLSIHLIQLSQSNITINFTKPSFLIPKKRNTESILKQITFRFLKRRICSSQKKSWKGLTCSVSEKRKILNAFTYITDGKDIQLREVKEEVTSGDSWERAKGGYRLVFQTVERKRNYTFIGRD